MASGRRNADDILLTALACGSTVDNAAAKAGISRCTAHRRLKDPEFQRRLADLRADTIKRTTAMLSAAAFEAVKTLVSLQDTKTPPAVRLGAARAILELGFRGREIIELEQRLAALEERLAGNPQVSIQVG